MCLIIQMQHKDKIITKEEFKINLNKNPHGTGVMFVQDGRVIVKKALGKEENQLGLYSRHLKHFRKGRIKELFVHSRLATHGDKNEINCHPYQILNKEEHGKDLWCMHNGIINVKERDKSKSDTWHFLNLYIKPIIEKNYELMHNDNFKEMVSDFIGRGNKLVFLDSDNTSFFINKEQGTDYNGCWISNTYSGIYKKFVPTNNYYDNKKKEVPTNGTYLGAYGNYSEEDDYFPASTPVKKVNDLFKPIPKKETYIKESFTRNEKGVYTPMQKDTKKVNLPALAASAVLAKQPVIDLNKKQDTEILAINHGVKILLMGAIKMSEHELYTLVVKEPIIATEMLQELLSSVEIKIGRF